jgi:hypothetical protein
VKIDSADGVLRGIFGRVTTLFPGEACLFCRGRVTAAAIALEALDPVERRARAAERYVPELDENDPAVITFTTAVAAQGITEMLHRLTGFMGEERDPRRSSSGSTSPSSAATGRHRTRTASACARRCGGEGTGGTSWAWSGRSTSAFTPFRARTGSGTSDKTQQIAADETRNSARPTSGP